MPAKRDTAIDELYAAPVGEFVERRDALAKDLRSDGDREAADTVKALRKPTVAAWTVNQLARREKMRIRSLLTAGERLRTAHGKLLQGGSPTVVQGALADERKAIRALVEAAEAILSEAGHTGVAPTLARVEETLHAAALDEEVGARLREGRLAKEEEAAGFGFGALPADLPKPKPAERAKASTAKQREAEEKLREAEERLAGAREEEKEAERSVRDLRGDLKRAERELAACETAVERAEAEVERRRKQVERA